MIFVVSQAEEPFQNIMMKETVANVLNTFTLEDFHGEPNHPHYIRINWSERSSIQKDSSREPLLRGTDSRDDASTITTILAASIVVYTTYPHTM